MSKTFSQKRKEFTTSRTKLKTKQRLKTLTLQNIIMYTYPMYYGFVLCTFIASHT